MTNKAGLADLVGLAGLINVMDVGASCIAETPAYRKLLDAGIAHLTAFEGDSRQVELIKRTYADRVDVRACFLGDGSEHDLHLASPASGMTSLLAPDPRGLAFFNGFSRFGNILSRERIMTKRLDDLEGVSPVDFLKMDAQGSELMVMKNGQRTLAECIAIQLEVSFVPLYKSQPSFGEVDVWMRANGYLPHCFAHLKRWSIAPTIRDGNFRLPFNQLLEADIVYVRHLVEPEKLTDIQLRKMAVIADVCLKSPDLCVHVLRELIRRGILPDQVLGNYMAQAGRWVA